MDNTTEQHDKAALRAEVTRLWDNYCVLLALRDAEKNTKVWQQLNHMQQQAFRQWLFAQDRLTMRSHVDSYPDDMKLGGR